MIPLSPDAVISQTTDGTITAWDISATRLFGFAAEEAIGQPIDSIVPPDRLSEARDALARILAGEPEVALETVRLRKDRRPLQVGLKLYPSKDEHGRVIGVFNVARDLVELRREANARAHLASIIDGSDDAIVSKDLDGTIRSWNRSAERIFGYSAAEAVGRSILLIIPSERAAEEERVLAAIRRGETVDHFETKRRRKNGSLVDISLTVSPVRDAEGKIVGASKIARDITQRKVIEAQRDELYEQAQKNNRAKDEFLAMLSHELRNPIGAISSALYVLEMAPPGAEVGQRAREIIGHQIRQLTRIVDDLLDVARVITGKVRLDRQPVELGGIVESAVNTLKVSGRVEQHSVRLAVEPAWVLADAVRIEQVVRNLLDNAIKYTPAGKAIRVTSGKQGAHAVFQVEDEGEGIPSELLPDVFELFVQGEQAPERSQGGLGLGLTLVKRLVELHGGSVTAFSEGTGRGSRFSVRLPAIAERATAPAQPAVDAIAPRRVLIVEDDSDTSEMLCSLLQLAGHEVFEARDGEQGIEAGLRLAPDVVLIDIGLPRQDGFEVARRLRKALGDALLVAVTGYGQNEDRRRSAEAGFDLHLVKPVDASRLADILGSHRRAVRAPGA